MRIADIKQTSRSCIIRQHMLLSFMAIVLLLLTGCSDLLDEIL